MCSSLCPVWLWKVCCLVSWLISANYLQSHQQFMNCETFEPKVPVNSKKPWYCRSWVEVQYPTWAFRRGRMNVCKICPWIVNSVHKSLNALRAYKQTSRVQEKAAGECIHLRNQYQEAQDNAKKEKHFVAKCFSAWRISEDSATIFWTPKLYIQLDSSC